MFEYWMKADLKSLPKVYQLPTAFQQDSGANKIGAEVTDNGSPVTLSGTVSASIIKADGTTITASGSKSGNRAWVVLPQGAYSVVGRLRVILKITSGSTVTSLGAVEGNVYQTITSEVVS